MYHTKSGNSPLGKRNRKILLMSICACFLPLHLQAQGSPEADVGGYLKELGSVGIGNDLKTYHYDNILHHRLETKVSFGSYLSVQADLRTRLFHGWSVQQNPDFGWAIANDPGYFDLSRTLVDTDDAVLNMAIDRLQLSFEKGAWEVHAGRQRINWGKTLVWNPNDLFNAYAYLDFDYEERPGTDAVYARYSWSYASSVEGGYRLGKSWDESVLALMLRGNIGEYDVQAIAGNYYDQLALGLGWSGYLQSAGFKGELSYFGPRDQWLKEKGHVTGSLGSDYMFGNGVYLSTEFLYNGGWDRSSNALETLVRPPRADDLFIAETGYFVQSSFSINPLTGISGGVLGSFDRKMLILIPQLTHSLGENTDLLILAQLLKGPVFTEITETPNLFYVRLKWSY